MFFFPLPAFQFSPSTQGPGSWILKLRSTDLFNLLSPAFFQAVTPDPCFFLFVFPRRSSLNSMICDSRLLLITLRLCPRTNFPRPPVPMWSPAGRFLLCERFRSFFFSLLLCVVFFFFKYLSARCCYGYCSAVSCGCRFSFHPMTTHPKTSLQRSIPLYPPSIRPLFFLVYLTFSPPPVHP